MYIPIMLQTKDIIRFSHFDNKANVPSEQYIMQFTIRSCLTAFCLEALWVYLWLKLGLLLLKFKLANGDVQYNEEQ